MKQMGPKVQKGQEGTIKLIPEEGKLVRFRIALSLQHATGDVPDVARWQLTHALRVSCAGEDLWHVYNLVRTGDLVTATTFRKIQRESGAGQESEKIKLKLSIRVETIDFDPEGIVPASTWISMLCQCCHAQIDMAGDSTVTAPMLCT